MIVGVMTLPHGAVAAGPQCAHWRALQPCLACGRSPSNAGHHHCWPLEPRGPLGQGCHFPTQVGPVHSTRGVFPNRRPAGQGGRSSSGASLLPALEFPGPASWRPRPGLCHNTRPSPSASATPGRWECLGGSWRLLTRPLESGADRPQVGGGPEKKREGAGPILPPRTPLSPVPHGLSQGPGSHPYRS